MRSRLFFVACVLAMLALFTTSVLSYDEEDAALEALLDSILAESEAQSQTLCVTASVLNVRWCADTSCRIVGTRNRGVSI